LIIPLFVVLSKQDVKPRFRFKSSSPFITGIPEYNNGERVVQTDKTYNPCARKIGLKEAGSFAHVDHLDGNVHGLCIFFCRYTNPADTNLQLKRE